jgi:hypothetical protein
MPLSGGDFKLLYYRLILSPLAGFLWICEDRASDGCKTMYSLEKVELEDSWCLSHNVS